MNRKAKIVIVPATEALLPAIREFAQREYGPNSHQASGSFHQWLYQENPNCPNGLASMVVAVDDAQQVVGFINRVFMTWEVQGEKHSIPAIVDFAVDPDHRQGGLGLRLVLRCTSDIAHAFINGSNPNSAPLFRSLKYQELDGGHWFRKILSPIRAPFRYGLHRINKGMPSPHALLDQQGVAPYATSSDPDHALLQQLAALLNGADADVKLFWTVETLRWRFFHPLGPKHLLVHTSHSDGSLSNAMLISAGPVRGLNVGRLIAHRTKSIAEFAQMLTTVLSLARRAGLDAFLTATGDAQEASVFRDAGATELDTTRGTFFFHKRRDDHELFRHVLVQGAASDLGFESVPRGR